MDMAQEGILLEIMSGCLKRIAFWTNASKHTEVLAPLPELLCLWAGVLAPSPELLQVELGVLAHTKTTLRRTMSLANHSRPYARRTFNPPAVGDAMDACADS